MAHNTEPRLRGKTILIIEDDHFIAKVYVKWLTLAGAETLVAHNGALGLRALKEHAVDIIFLDLGMPGMNGFDTLAAIRDNPETRALPVVVLSNTTMNAQTDGFATLTAAGVTDILRKYETSLNQMVACAAKYFSHDEPAREETHSTT